jgi:succinate dehydrogenase flavin-adding protein (antitoxin of CptAB toxin-antitoxin module)
MGAFATKHLHSLSQAELEMYEQILGRETLDLYNIILGKERGPDELQGPLLERIKAFVQSCPLGKGPSDYAKQKSNYSN